MCATKQELLSLVQPTGQEHLLAFWDELDASARGVLAEQIRAVDFDLVSQLFRQERDAEDWGQMAGRAESPPAYRLGALDNSVPPRKARQRGEQALRDGRVGVILVAGGQGTRLGFPHPKGMFSLGPVSGRSLFEIHVDRLRAVARRYGAPIPLYLMTSPATHDETVEFFQRHQRFGLSEKDLRFFCQGTMPAVDQGDGMILLADRHQLSLSPDGHGGTLAALVHRGCLADMQQRGVQHVFLLSSG